jgi:hypothetical protein
MSDQERWSAVLRAVPVDFGNSLAGVSDAAIRHRPAEGEWSAIEVTGHLVDKMRAWCTRVERVAAEEQPFLAGYDQDEYVRVADYQHGGLDQILSDLSSACERFAAVVDEREDADLERQGVHGERGPITLRECIELPLESVNEHLAQLRAALANYGGVLPTEVR